MLKNVLLTWLFTCFIGTLVLCLFLAVMEGRMRTGEMELVALVGLGITLLASIPAMIIYGLLANMLIAKMGTMRAKALCSVYAVIATAISCIITFGSRGGGILEGGGGILLLFVLPYAACFVLAIWIFPLPTPNLGLTAAAEVPTVPSGTFSSPAFITVAAIIGCQLVYSISSWITGALSGRNVYFSTAWHIIDIGLLTAGLILFIRWKAAGWKILVLLSAGGLIGVLLSLASTISMMTRYGAEAWRFYIMMFVFGLLDGLALFLLQRPDLRSRFGCNMKDYGAWILAGLGYALVRVLLTRMMYGV